MVENLNEHRKGLLGKTVPIGNMLTWTKASILVAMLLYFYHYYQFFDIPVIVLCSKHFMFCMLLKSIVMYLFER